MKEENSWLAPLLGGSFGFILGTIFHPATWVGMVGLGILGGILGFLLAHFILNSKK